MFVSAPSVEGKIEIIQFSRVSNSKFMIFPQIYPRVLNSIATGEYFFALRLLQGNLYSRGMLLNKQHIVYCIKVHWDCVAFVCVLYWLLAAWQCVALNHSLVGSGRAGGAHAEIMESHGTSGADINDQPPDVRMMITYVSEYLSSVAKNYFFILPF